MTFFRSLGVLSISLFLAQARRLPGHRHEAFNLQVRQAEPEGMSGLATPAGILTVITPSPGASPVQVTKQSQIVTSYVPLFTLCDLPPIGVLPLSRPTTIPSTAPFKNYTMTIPPGNGTCTTMYTEIETMVCATTLTDLTTTYKVSKCPQDITFSTQLGYVIATPTATANLTTNSTRASGNSSALITPAPSIRTLTTYFIAPWQQLTTAGPPEDVDLKVCAMLANGTKNCVREYQVWKTSLLTSTATSTYSVNFTTTIQGPSQLLVKNFVANITETLVDFSMSTTMLLEYITEERITETISVSSSTEPTVYQTQTVNEVTGDITSTITRRITSTIHGGTTTITLGPGAVPYAAVPAPTAAEGIEETEEPGEPEEATAYAPTTTSYANFASILGADGYRH